MQTYQNRTHETFKQTLQKGEQGEVAFIQYCESKNIPLIDVRNDKEFQKIDVDFIVGNKGTRVEIKTEYSYGKYSKDKQRFYVEDISSQSINSDGWYRYCQADILVDFDALNNIMYFFRLVDLKEYIETFYEKDKKKVDYVKLQKGSCGYVVYIQPFLQWLNDNNKYNEIIE
ncbi:MAG: hypothetical protein AAGU76_02800 [Sedimentibacter sp.]|uniref:hypothetical protein n=1 Tax=Sedimentibacter sp. TaxID=1960295 RepID=UPI0031588BF2